MRTVNIIQALILMSLNCRAATWYVDNAAAGANNGTSWANAWQSFAAISWGSVSAGDEVYISGGSTSKVYNEQMTIGSSGASGNPISILPGIDASHNGTVVIQGVYAFPGGNPTNANFTRHGIYATSKNYLKVDGGSPIRLICTNVNVGVLFEDGTGNTVRYVSVTNSFRAVQMQNDSGGLIEFCEGKMLDGGGIRVSGMNHALGTSVIRNNLLEVRYYDGISIDSGCDVSGNWVRKSDNEEWTTPPHFSHPDGIVMGGSNNNVHHNAVDGYEQNIYIDNIIFSTTSTHDTLTNTTVWANVISSNSIAGCTNLIYGIVPHAEQGNLSGVYLYNNSIESLSLGIQTTRNGSYAISNLWVTNNLIAKGYTQLSVGVDTNTFRSDYNWYTAFNGYSDVYGSIGSLAAWKSDYPGMDTHSQAGTPNLKDAGIGLSPAYSSALSVGATFPNPPIVTRGGAWDIGAYEYSSVVDLRLQGRTVMAGRGVIK